MTPGSLSAVAESRLSDAHVQSGSVRFPAVVGCVTPSEQTKCVQFGCRYHLAHADRGGRRLAVIRDCALTVANEGPHTLEDIAQILGLTRERVRQIEGAAIAKLQSNRLLKKLHGEVG